MVVTAETTNINTERCSALVSDVSMGFSTPENKCPLRKTMAFPWYACSEEQRGLKYFLLQFMHHHTGDSKRGELKQLWDVPGYAPPPSVKSLLNLVLLPRASAISAELVRVWGRWFFFWTKEGHGTVLSKSNYALSFPRDTGWNCGLSYTAGWFCESCAHAQPFDAEQWLLLLSVNQNHLLRR